MKEENEGCGTTEIGSSPPHGHEDLVTPSGSHREPSSVGGASKREGEGGEGGGWEGGGGRERERGECCPAIVHGEPLTDRKSTFQAHAAAVNSKTEVNPHTNTHIPVHII